MFKKLKKSLIHGGDKVRTRSNAGDRHHGRKAVRKERRDKVRADKHSKKLETIALRRANKATTFGSFIEKVGPIVNQFVGRKQQGQEVESGFMNADGSFEGSDGVSVMPNPDDKMYLSNHASELYSQSGGTPFKHHDFTDKDVDGLDDETGLSEAEHNALYDNANNRKSTVEPVNPMSFSWKKTDLESYFAWFSRLIMQKPLYIIPALLVLVFGLFYYVFKLVKWLKNKFSNKPKATKKY